MPTFLTIHQVNVHYGSNQVLRDINLEVQKGEFLALLGASGCGKTTLLNVICGFKSASSGKIFNDEQDITDLPPEKREMAMVFQSYALWPHMTAKQNIAYGLKLRRQSRDQISTRVSEILELLNLNEFGERLVTQLSGGQRQRVALGRALAVDPKLLLMDEPLSNLDARIRQTVRHEIKALQKKLNITAIMVTHDREEAMIMADRIVVLTKEGKIAQQGTPEEVFNQPNSQFVAEFMGAENVLSLKVRAEEKVLVIEAGPYNQEALIPKELFSRNPIREGSGAIKVHFRSETAVLTPIGTAESEGLLLEGRVSQVSYPGGFFRHAVAVGDRTFLVDHEQRMSIGKTVGIYLKPEHLHLFRE